MPLKFEKPNHTTKRKKDARDKKRDWVEVVKAVMQRDGYRCRACSTRGEPHNPVDPHHIKFRSAGGKDTEENVVAMCRECHDEIHAYRLAVIGTNAKKVLRFVRRDVKD